MKNKIILTLLGLAALALASCNTMQGMGRDIQSAGQAISESAQR